MEFITSGRFRAVSDPVGIDLMMRFHQLIALFGLHHTLDAGRYSAAPYSAAFWVVAVCVALAALAWIHVVRSLRQLRNAYRLRSVERCADRTWTLRLEPVSGARFAFDAGQFAWVKLRNTPFGRPNIPFLSAPAHPNCRPLNS